MRKLGALALVLAIAGCAGEVPPLTTTPVAAERMARADGFAEKADIARSICVEAGRRPGTDRHASCIRSLLRAEGARARSRADALAARAARMAYTCFDRERLRLVRCYDI